PGVGITFRGRFPGEIANAVRPFLFRTNALFGERFDSVAKKCAAVLPHRPFDRALVVVNKEPAEIDKRRAVLDLEKLERADQRVGGATAELSLVFNRRTFLSQINFWRQLRQPRCDYAVGKIAMVGQVRQPSVPFGRTFIDFGAHVIRRISLRDSSKSGVDDNVENTVRESIDLHRGETGLLERAHLGHVGLSFDQAFEFVLVEVAAVKVFHPPPESIFRFLQKISYVAKRLVSVLLEKFFGESFGLILDAFKNAADVDVGHNRSTPSLSLVFRSRAE